MFKLIYEIPHEQQSMELVMQNVSYNGALLKFVKAEFKTIYVCIEAIKESVRALEYLPIEMYSPDSRVLKLANKLYGAAMFEYIPINYQSSEIINEYLNVNNSNSIEEIKDKITITNLIKCLDIRLITREMWLAFISKGVSSIIKYVPDNILSDEDYIYLARNNAYILEHLPADKQSIVLLQYISYYTPEIVRNINPKIINTQLFYEIIRNDIAFLADLYPNFNNPDFDIDACLGDPNNIGYLENSLTNKYIRYIPSKYQTYDMWWHVATRSDNFDSFAYMNPELQTFEICIIAVNSMDSNILFVRKDIINKEFYEAIVRKNPAISQFNIDIKLDNKSHYVK